MKHLMKLLALLLVASGCCHEDVSLEPDESADGTVPVKLNFNAPYAVRSSVAPDEYHLEDVNVFVYTNGLLAAEVYLSDVADTVIELDEGFLYNMYAVANAGDIAAVAREEDFVNDCVCEISGISDLASVIPMRWSRSGVEVRSGMLPVEVRLSRMVSKVTLTIDKSLLGGIEVQSVRLCQSALCVYPFNDFSGLGSRVESTRQVADGDYASDADIEALNAGESICFYTMENCQGVLLPGNDDVWAKVPDRLGGVADLCTYVEISCRFDDEGFMTGETVYRFYLGMDNTADFNVPGNSDIGVELVLTDDGLYEMSWKVDADVAVRDGLVSGAPVQHQYALDDLYVGEVFQYDLRVPPVMQDFYGGDISGCRLVFVPDEGDVESLMFGTLGKVLLLNYRAEVQCRYPGTGSIWLCNPDGHRILELEDNVVVKMPEMVLSDKESVSDSYVFTASSTAAYCQINGGKSLCYIYFLDDNGKNLNSTSAYGFNLRFFNLTGTVLESEFDIDETLSYAIKSGIQRSGAYAFVIGAECSHDGTDHELNEALTDAYAADVGFRMTVNEIIHGMSRSFDWILDIEMVTLTLVDNGWAGYHDCQISVQVDNPSRLPLDVSVWQVNTSDDSWNAVSRNEIIDYVENSLEVSHISYIGRNHYTGMPPLYGNGDSFRCEENSYGDEYVADGTLLVYPLPSIHTSDVHSAMLYDKKGHSALCNLVDVSVGGLRTKFPSVSVVDALSDGSAAYGAVYGAEGWNDRGIWLYGDKYQMYEPDSALDGYPELTPLALDGLANMLHGEIIDLNFSYSDGNLYIYSYEGYLKHMSVDLDFAIEVQGYVKTYPNGTMFSPKINTCTETLTGTVSGVPLFSQAGVVSADNGLIKQAMDAVYAHTYADSKNMMGSANSYQHHAHPVSVTCEIMVRVPSSSIYGIWPVSIQCDTDALSYYHEQEGQTYSCKFTPSVPVDSFVLVDKM